MTENVYFNVQTGPLMTQVRKRTDKVSATHKNI